MLFKEREIEAYKRWILRMTFTEQVFYAAKKTLGIYFSINHTSLKIMRLKNSYDLSNHIIYTSRLYRKHYHPVLIYQIIRRISQSKIVIMNIFRINRIIFNTFRYVMNFRWRRNRVNINTFNVAGRNVPHSFYCQ